MLPTFQLVYQSVLDDMEVKSYYTNITTFKAIRLVYVHSEVTGNADSYIIKDKTIVQKRL